MTPRRRIPRRDFLKGVAGVAGASVLASCAPKATATVAPTTAAGAAAATAAPVLKYADEACLHRYLRTCYGGLARDLTGS